MMIWLERIGIGLLLTLLVFTSSAVALTSPGLTRLLVARSGGSEVSGLTEDEALDAAEEVRRYVLGQADALPETVAGRPGFDGEAVAHLDDVAGALSFARMLASLSAALLAVWLSWSLARRRSAAIRDSFNTGALLTAMVVLVLGVFALFDFERFFTGFHAALFDAGTWMFPEGTLLIALFPERFWVAMATLWGLLGLLGALLLWGVGANVGGRLGEGAGDSSE